MPMNWTKDPDEEYCNVRESRRESPNGHITRVYDDTISWSGLCMGGKIRIIKYNSEINGYLLRKSGFGGWAGIGTTVYHPPEYMIGFIINDRWNSRARIEYTKKHMKEAKTKAEIIFNKMIEERKNAPKRIRLRKL
jgi:hypothetical protein